MTEHNRTAWASMTTVSEMLVAADGIDRIEFYVSKFENSPAELKCRVHSLPGMSKAQVDDLALKLNEAIAPVLIREQNVLQNKAANQLMRFL